MEHTCKVKHVANYVLVLEGGKGRVSCLGTAKPNSKKHLAEQKTSGGCRRVLFENDEQSASELMEESSLICESSHHHQHHCHHRCQQHQRAFVHYFRGIGLTIGPIVTILFVNSDECSVACGRALLQYIRFRFRRQRHSNITNPLTWIDRSILALEPMVLMHPSSPQVAISKCEKILMSDTLRVPGECQAFLFKPGSKG